VFLTKDFVGKLSSPSRGWLGKGTRAGSYFDLSSQLTGAVAF